MEQKAQLDDWRQNRYMLARTYAETAHCLGHLLVLMPKDRSIRADFLPDLVSLFGDQVAEGIRDPDGLADRRKLADRLYALSQEQHKMARQIDPIYKQEWKADLNARLSEVRGYAQFRHAEWLPAKDDKAFKEECNQAVRSLQDAELRKPRHYALLQNIGMIYLSRRFDSPGANLEQAERYYSRSIELKPGDYFGHGQLALVGLRRALQATDQSARNEAIKVAEDRVVKALQLRPESQTTRLLRLYLRLASLGLDGKPAKIEELDALLADIQQQDPKEQDVSRRWLSLACGWLRLLASADEAAFNPAKGDLNARMEKFVSDVKDKEDAIWRVAQIREAIDRISRELGSLNYTNRFKPRFEFDAVLRLIRDCPVWSPLWRIVSSNFSAGISLRLSERSKRRWLDRAVAYWRIRGFPYPELSQSQIEADVGALRRVEPDEILVDRRAMASTVGLRLANAYHPQMWEIPRHGRSAVDCFLDDRRLRRALEKAARFYPNRRRWNCAMSPQCLAIPASIAGFKLSAGGRACPLPAILTRGRATPRFLGWFRRPVAGAAHLECAITWGSIRRRVKSKDYAGWRPIWPTSPSAARRS